MNRPEMPRRLPFTCVAAIALALAGSPTLASDGGARIQALAWVQGAAAPSHVPSCDAFLEPTGALRLLWTSEFVYQSGSWSADAFPNSPGATAQYVSDPLARRYLALSTNGVLERPRTGTEWTALATTGTPPQNFSDAVFDPVRNRVLVVDYTLDQLWQLTLDGPPTWTSMMSIPNVSRRALYDPIADRLMVWNGSSVTWLPLDQPSPTWTSEAITGTPPSIYASVAHDIRHHRLVHWGGGTLDCTIPPCHMVYNTSTHVVNLDGAPAWSQILTTAHPSSRFSHLMSYDHLLDRVVMVGGVYDPGLAADLYLADSWTLPLESGDASHLEFAPSAIDFGEVGGPGTYQQTVQVDNVGPTYTVVFAAVSNSPNVTVDTRAFALSPGQSRTLTVTWNGEDVALDATIEIESSDPAVPLRSIPVAGSAPSLVGVGGPQAANAFGLTVAGRNPSPGPARLELAMPAGGAVEVAVYDLRGSRIRTLVEGMRGSGRTAIAWDGRDDEGRPAGASVYFVRARAGQATAQAKVVLAR